MLPRRSVLLASVAGASALGPAQLMRPSSINTAASVTASAPVPSMSMALWSSSGDIAVHPIIGHRVLKDIQGMGKAVAQIDSRRPVGQRLERPDVGRAAVAEAEGRHAGGHSTAAAATVTPPLNVAVKVPPCVS